MFGYFWTVRIMVQTRTGLAEFHSAEFIYKWGIKVVVTRQAPLTCDRLRTGADPPPPANWNLAWGESGANTDRLTHSY